LWSRGIVVGRGCGLEDVGSNPGRGKIFFFSKSSTPDVDPPASYSMRTFFFRGVKVPVRDVDFSSPFGIEFKNTCK
jgi:hypothetical protein